MQCRVYPCEGEAMLQGVDGWGVYGTRIDIPTCDSHTRCPTCGNLLEVDPISGNVACFMHGEFVLSEWYPIERIFSVT